MDACDPRSPEFHIAAAARLEVIRSLELRGRIPDCAELARSIERAVRRELVEAEILGALRTSRQYSLLLEQLIPAWNAPA